MKRLTALIETQSTDTINGFVIIKPGFLAYKDQIMTLLKNNGWRVVQQGELRLSKKQAEELYRDHKGKGYYDSLCSYMCSGPCACFSCCKDCTDPIKDMSALKEKVRGRWGQDEMKNVMHSSDSTDNAARESKVVFNNLTESTAGIAATTEGIIAELVSLYAEEVNAFYQYWVVAEFLTGKERANIQQKYKEYAADELFDHAAKILQRLNQLGADVRPLVDLYANNTLARDKYVVPDMSYDTVVSLTQNIMSEENAIQRYKNAVIMTEDADPTTNMMLKEILKDEEEHITELREFLQDITNHNMYA